MKIKGKDLDVQVTLNAIPAIVGALWHERFLVGYQVSPYLG
jgi:hypothetical protein